MRDADDLPMQSVWEKKPASEVDDARLVGERPETYCRPCRSEYGKRHYAANRQRYIEWARILEEMKAPRWLRQLPSAANGTPRRILANGPD